MKRFVHEASPMDMLNNYKSKQVADSTKVEAAYESEEQYELVDRKQVYDSDGFTTDYSLYYDVLNDRFVTVFGDHEIYRPEDGDFDMEFETESEALEWFDDYNGFDDEEGD